MPFELGLAVAWDKLNAGQHVWFVLEAKSRRVHKSLSDLGGTDAYIHGGTKGAVVLPLDANLPDGTEVRVEPLPAKPLSERLSVATTHALISLTNSNLYATLVA